MLYQKMLTLPVGNILGYFLFYFKKNFKCWLQPQIDFTNHCRLETLFRTLPGLSPPQLRTLLPGQLADGAALSEVLPIRHFYVLR